MNWHYAVGQQRFGPVSEQELARLAAAGTIGADTLVWREGMSNWQRYAEVVSAPASSPVMAGTGEDTEICAVSGKRYPKREMVQYEGKWISAEHRDEFFQRLREGVALPGSLVYGTFGQRFLAKLLDGVILWIVGAIKTGFLAWLILGSFDFFRPTAQPGQTGRLFLFQGINVLLGLAIGLIYAWFFLARYQATPGKMALGLKVVRADGSRLSTGRIIGRYFAETLSGLILCIGYIMAAFDEPECRTLHDRICDTRVIKARD
jgi:uncharacterized RDD family membrane protein YckC